MAFLTALAWSLPVLVALLRPAGQKHLKSFVAAPSKAAATAVMAELHNNYWGRKKLILWQQTLQQTLSGHTANDAVLVGREHWLYLHAAGFNEDACMAHVPFAAKARSAWTQSLTAWQRRVADAGGQLIVLLVPDKHTVYPEHLPYHLQDLAPSRLDALIADLSHVQGLVTIDVRSALAAAKRAERLDLYHRLDTHWNDLGGFVAYQQLARHLVPRVPTATTTLRSAFDMTCPKTTFGDLSFMLGEHNVEAEPRCDLKFVDDVASSMQLSPDTVTRLRTSHSQSAGFARVVMFGDSFSHALVNFLSRDVADGYYIAADNLDLGIINYLRAPTVILEILERRLYANPPRLPDGDQGHIALLEGFFASEDLDAPLGPCAMGAHGLAYVDALLGQEDIVLDVDVPQRAQNDRPLKVLVDNTRQFVLPMQPGRRQHVVAAQGASEARRWHKIELWAPSTWRPGEISGDSHDRRELSVRLKFSVRRKDLAL